MVQNMKIGKMDGFCVGEPWNARSIAENIGFTSLTTQEMWPDHPEKVCAFTEEFAEKNPKTVKAVLKALHEASVWLDDLGNREEQCRIVSPPTYINCPAEIILGRMLGKYDYGDGRTKQDDHYMIFSQRNCNYPQPKYGKWWLSQFRRWGMVEGPPDYEGIVKKVMRGDLYEEAMKEIGYAHGGPNTIRKRCSTASTFDPAKPEEYAASFAVKNLKGCKRHVRTPVSVVIGWSCRWQVMLLVVAAWWLSSVTWAKGLPTPLKTWEMSKIYVLEPFAKRGELDQGILRFTWNSLVLVAKGFSLGVMLGVPLGFILGTSKLFTRAFDPDHSDPAARVAAGLAAAGRVPVSKAGAGGGLHDRGLLDVADGGEHGPRRAGRPAGLPERGQGAEALDVDDHLEDLSSGDAALHVHGLSPEPGDRLAGDRGGRNADRHAGRRRLFVARVSEPDLRAHHPLHRRHRRWLASCSTG